MFVEFFIYSLVFEFVKTYPLEKVADGSGTVDVLVVWWVDFDLAYVGFDDFRVVADGLDVEETEAVVLGAVVIDKLATVAACIGSIEYL